MSLAITVELRAALRAARRGAAVRWSVAGGLLATALYSVRPTLAILAVGFLVAGALLTTGARAVGNAVGANPVAWLIPCHNVLRKDGSLGNYHWGADRKRAMLAWSSLRASPPTVPRPRSRSCARSASG